MFDTNVTPWSGEAAAFATNGSRRAAAGVPLTLPTANNTSEKPDTQGQRVVAIDSRSQFYVNLDPVTADDLVPRVQRALEDKTEKLVLREG